MRILQALLLTSPCQGSSCERLRSTNEEIHAGNILSLWTTYVWSPQTAFTTPNWHPGSAQAMSVPGTSVISLVVKNMIVIGRRGGTIEGGRTVHCICMFSLHTLPPLQSEESASIVSAFHENPLLSRFTLIHSISPSLVFHAYHVSSHQILSPVLVIFAGNEKRRCVNLRYRTLMNLVIK